MTVTNPTSGNSGQLAPNGSVQLTLGIPFIPSAGAYSGTVTISATSLSGATVADSPIIIPVSLQVSSGNLTATPPSLTFTQTLGTTASTQTISIGSSTSQPLSFNASTQGSGNWLSINPTSGTTPATLTVSVDGSKLTPSATPYSGQIILTSPGSHYPNDGECQPYSISRSGHSISNVTDIHANPRSCGACRTTRDGNWHSFCCWLRYFPRN